MSRRPSNNMPPLSFTPSANRQNNMQPPYSYPPANRQMPGHRNPDFQKQRIPSFNSSDLRQILSHRFSGVQQHPSIALQDGLTLRPQSPHTNGQAPARRQSNYATQAPSLSPPLNRQNPEQHMPGPQQQPMDAFVRTSPMPNPFVEQGGAAVEWRPPPANGQPFTDPHIGGGEVQRHERPRNGFVEEQGRRWW